MRKVLYFISHQGKRKLKPQHDTIITTRRAKMTMTDTSSVARIWSNWNFKSCCASLNWYKLFGRFSDSIVYSWVYTNSHFGLYHTEIYIHQEMHTKNPCKNWKLTCLSRVVWINCGIQQRMNEPQLHTTGMSIRNPSWAKEVKHKRGQTHTVWLHL